MLKELFQYQGPGEEFHQERQNCNNYTIDVDDALPSHLHLFLLSQLLVIPTCHDNVEAVVLRGRLQISLLI